MKPTLLIWLIALCLLNGCNDYVIVNLKAPKECFYEDVIVTFKGQHSSSQVSLITSPVECHQVASKTEKKTSTHTYSWYYPEICAQRLDAQNNISGLSHWVRSYSALNERSIVLIFEKDRIYLPTDLSVENLDLNVHLGTDSIDGVYFDTVYIARPAPESHFLVDSVYYVPNMGIIRIFTSDGETWERQF